MYTTRGMLSVTKGYLLPGLLERAVLDLSIVRLLYIEGVAPYEVVAEQLQIVEALGDELSRRHRVLRDSNHRS